MEAQKTRIERALDLVVETCPGLNHHAEGIKVAVANLEKDDVYRVLLNESPDAMLSMAVGEIGRDLIYCLEQAIDHMDAGRA